MRTLRLEENGKQNRMNRENNRTFEDWLFSNINTKGNARAFYPPIYALRVPRKSVRK